MRGYAFVTVSVHHILHGDPVSEGLVRRHCCEYYGSNNKSAGGHVCWVIHGCGVPLCAMTRSSFKQGVRCDLRGMAAAIAWIKKKHHHTLFLLVVCYVCRCAFSPHTTHHNKQTQHNNTSFYYIFFYFFTNYFISITCIIINYYYYTTQTQQ